MSTAALIMIILIAMSGGIALTKHGQPRAPFSFWMWLFSASIELGLLYWGGFFSKI